MNSSLPFRDNYAVVLNFGGGRRGRKTGRKEKISAARKEELNKFEKYVLFWADNTKSSSGCSRGSWDCPPSVANS
jgi:hypothetical protein